MDIDIEKIINKLNEMDESFNTNNTYYYNNPIWNNWTLEERKKLLELYFIISKKESHIFDLIYNYHGCDSWEDIFRDYDKVYLKDKEIGVKIAIDEINRIEKEE